MRYVIQIIVMLSDVFVVSFLGYILYLSPNIITLILVIIGFKVWLKNDGLIAWKPKTIKTFLKNSKQMGI